MFNFDVVAAYQDVHDAETPGVQSGQRIAQSFTSLEDLLYRVELLFLPEPGNADGRLRFELYRGRWVHERPHESTSPLVFKSIELSRFAQGGWWSFEFSPLKGSQGRVYTVILTVVGEGRLRLGKTDGAGRGHSLSTVPQTGTLAYRAVAVRDRAMFENFKRFRDGLDSAALWVDHLPVMMRLEISKTCNQKCIMCQHGSSDFRLGPTETKHMSLKTFEEVAVPLLPTTIELVAFGLGEPFLNRDFMGMLRLAKSVNPLVRITVSTNGTLLTDDMIREIVDEQLIDIFQISIDGACEETYAKIRKRAKTGNDYDTALTALKTTIAYKSRNNRYYPRIKTEMMVNKHTSEEIFTFVKQMTDFGVNIILLDSVKGDYPGLKLTDCDNFAGMHAQMLDARAYTERHGVTLEGPLFSEIPAVLAQKGRAPADVV